MVLEAAYEATLLAAIAQASGRGSRTVLLTRLGGGAFGNHSEWIDDAISRALSIGAHAGLDIRWWNCTPILRRKRSPPAGILGPLGAWVSNTLAGVFG